jgi:hypothetical protein
MDTTTLLACALLIAVVGLLAWRLHARKPGPNLQDGARVELDLGGLPKAASHDEHIMPEQQTRILDTRARARPCLLNTSEQTLYRRLVEVMPNMMVFAQVSMAHLVQMLGRRADQPSRKMVGRSVDFLVCRDDFTILAAIELMWPTQLPDEQGNYEDLKRAALEELGIPLIVFRPNQLPDVDGIEKEIAAALLRAKHLAAQREA